MDTWTAITSRRNIRRFQDEPIPPEHLDQVLEAARRAPSAFNKQWWDLVVVTEPERLQALSGVWQGAGHVARSAATIAVVAPRGSDVREQGFIDFDLGQLTMQAMIAATDLGIGSGHAHVENQELARQVLGFPDDRHCAHLIVLGLPTEPMTPISKPKRRPFDDVVHREHW